MNKYNKKVDQLNAFELFTSKNGSSIKKQLALKFLKSLVVIIDDINVRYIDSGKVLRMHIDNITYDAFSSKDNSNTSKKAIISNIGLYGEFDDSGSIGKKNNQTNMLMIQEMICYIDIKQMNTYEQLCITINAPFLTGELKKETYEVVLQFFERLGTLGSVKKKQIAPLRKDIIENTRTIYTYMYNEKRNCNNEFDEELKNYENEMEIEEIIYLRKSALQQNTTNVDDIDYYKNTPEDSDEVMRICFLIENCNVYVMKNEDNVSLLALIGKIEMNLQVFGKGFHINLSIDSFALSDHQGKFKEVVKKVFRNDDIEQPLVSMIVEQVDEKQTTVLITILNTQIVITKEFMKTLGGFTKYHNNLEMSHIVKFIQEQAQVLINSTSKHWRDIVESSNLSLTLNIVEPTIFIPVSSNQTETPCLKLSFEKCVVFPTDTKLTYKYTISNIHVTFLSKFITTKEAQEIDVVKDISLDGQIIFENNSPIQIDSTLNSFNYLISKTKFSVFHKFIRQFTNEWSSSNDLKIQSIHPFLLMIKKWIQRVLSKSNSSFIFNTYFKTVDLSISPLEETKGNEFLNVHMENLFLGVVLLPSLFTLKYNLDQLQVYDCFNITKLPPLLSLNKKKSTACEGTLSIDDNTIPMIKVFLQLDDIGIIIEPTIVGELLKTAVAVISFFNRNKNDKLLETKQDVNNIESKQDNTIDNSTQTPFGVQLQLEIIIFKTDITLMQNPSTKVSIISIGGVKTTFTFDNTLTTQVSINKAIMWSKDSKTPIFSYKGSSPIQLSYSKMIQHIKTFDVHVRKVGLEMEKAELIILPNFIQQIVDIITSKSILQVIQPKKAKKVFNTVKRFSRRISSRDMVHSMFQHTTKTNLIHKEHSIIIPTISMLNFAISMQEDNEFVTTTFQTITINTLQNYNNDVITQSILLDFKDCKIYSSHIHTNKPIFSGQGAKVLEQTTEIDCSIQEPIQITLQTTEFKFLVNFSQHLKTKIEQKQWSQIKNIVTNYFSLKVSPSQQEFLYKHKKFNTHINHIVFVLCDQNELAHLDINDINLQLNIHKKEESLNTLFSIGNISLTTAENTQNLYSNILQTPKDQKFFSIQIKKKLLQPTTIDIVVSSLQIINNPDIFITILPYITTSSVNIKKIVCLLTNEKVIKETNKDVKILRCLKGSEIFEKLMVIGFSEYTTEYLCDELISLGILSGQYPFKHTEKYDILSAYKNDKQSILLPSFETKHSKILNSKHESKEKLMISFTYNKLSLLTLLNPNSLETPYIMCQCSGRVVYKQCYDDSFFFSFQTTNCELLSCISSNGMLTHSSHPINKEFKLTVSCIGVTENNHISIQTSCDIHCGIFNVSCTDLRTIYEFINKLNDIKKDIVNSNSLDTNVVDYEQYLYFPQIRFKKDIYSTTNINIDTSCVIVYHPTNKTPLLKIQINNNQSKLNQYNDDIVFSVLPELSVSYFNENFGEYEEVIHNIQTFLIFRLAIDLHNNTPEICKTLHIRFNQLKNDFTISHEMLSSLILFYQKFKTIKNIQHNKNSNNIYVIDQVSAKTLQTGKDDFVLKVWIEDQPVVQLNPNSLTPLHYNSTTTPTHFFISINNVTFKVPLTTTIPQKHILAQTCCIFSKMKYQQDGSKIITFTTQYLFKNFFHVPITINLNLGGKSKKSTMFVLDTFETRSIPLSFEGCDIFVEINKFKCIFL
ncbi:Vacuolar protein sorting-associated protein [Entamoeba marina]